jgi:hypothetical protein
MALIIALEPASIGDLGKKYGKLEMSELPVSSRLSIPFDT